MAELADGESALIRRLSQNSGQMMWFLGAGASRTAGMPTATDIIWDLKRRYYCLHENQDLQSHDVNNEAIRSKLQTYFESKGCPPIWSPSEYAFYFGLTFDKDLQSQQKYIAEQVDTKKISLNIGHRILAALIEMGLAKVIFTTNFDEVLENAVALVSGKTLSTFHIEGSYAALDALNAEQFPIYAKLHGDFRYRSIKNIPKDLQNNDAELQKCFLAAATRYGLVVSGYSGRDSNVIAMLNASVEQNNAFPQGLFWTTSHPAQISNNVIELIESAKRKRIEAAIVEVETFDVLFSKLWRQTPNKPDSLTTKVHTAKARPVSIPLGGLGTKYPILRTNALPIIDWPNKCGIATTSIPMTFQLLNEKVHENRPNGVYAFTDQIIFWGSLSELEKIADKSAISEVHDFAFDDVPNTLANSGILKSFFEHALVRSVCEDKPLSIRLRHRTRYAVVGGNAAATPFFDPLRRALGGTALTGAVPGIPNASWAEAASLRLEQKNGALWLLIRPDIWITPLAERENARAFLREKKLRRYNSQAYKLLDAWIALLLASVGSAQDVKVGCFANTEYPVAFVLSNRTAFSFGGTAHVG